MPDANILEMEADCHLGPDASRVLALFERAADYVRLESGAPPDLDYLRATFDGPPTLAAEDRFVLGLERGGELLGTAAYIRNFYDRDEWYMGLLLLDPVLRGQGYGTRLAQRVLAHARAEQGARIRIAVLDANARARAFWEAQGYELERSVAGDPNGDGHKRHVLKLELGG